MTEELEGQLGLFDLDSWSGKTSPEHSAATEARTSKPFSQRSSKSSSRTLPMCLCLTRGNGLKPDASTPTWETGALLGAYTTHSFGECPREENVSRLSQILEDSPHPKYSLSAKACQGILNRAERRGKELPEALRIALENQAQSPLKETEQENPTVGAATENQGGHPSPLTELNSMGSLSASKNELANQGGARASSFSVNTQERCQPSTTNPSGQNEFVPDVAQTLSRRYDGSPQPDKGNGANIVCAFKAGNGAKARSIAYEEEMSPTLSSAESGTNQAPTVAYGISAYESNAMKSSNPHSGVYETETSRTLDLNGGSPACNQGGGGDHEELRG